MIFVIIILGEQEYKKIYDNINELDTNFTCICRVISNVEEKEYTNKYIVRIEESSSFIFEKIKIILYTDKIVLLEYGDIIKVSGKLENPDKQRNAGGFDYYRYLKQNKIYGLYKADKIDILSSKEDLFYYIFKLREKCIKLLENNFGDKEAGLLKGLLLGDMSDISKEDEINFRKSNLSHVLAISGMHFTYILVVIDFIFDRIIIFKNIKYCFELLFILFFVIFTGGSVSCIRAGIMMLLIILSKLIHRNKDFCSNLFFSFGFILLLNPYNLENVGMWLSFLGTLALFLFNKKFEIKNKFINYIINNVYSSFSVQLLIFPIVAYFFNTISFTFFISNLLISIFSGSVVIIGYLYLFFYKINIFKKVERVLIILISKIAQKVGEINLSSVLIIKLNIFWVFFYYVVLIMFLKRNILKKYIKIITYKNNRSFINKMKKVCILFLCLILLIGYIYKINNNIIQINFIDVGQGDCTLITLKNKKTILIDGGDCTESFDYGERVVAPYLLNKGITNIDYMIISHFDSDHVGGLRYIVQNFKVQNIFIGVQFENNSNLDYMLNLIQDKNIKLKILEKGDKYIFDKEVFIEVLFPIKSEGIQENSINNNSLVFKLYLEGIWCLFTGDIESVAEMLTKYNKNNLKCDILKVPHHGSNTSSSDEFVELTKPQIVLIGCGKNNKFGHPNKGVLNKYKEINAKIYRTDLNGEINIKIKNKKIFIEKMFL